MRKLLTFLSVITGIYSYSQTMCGGQSATITAGNPQNLTNPQYSLNPGGFSPISGTNQFQISPLVTTAYTIYTTGTNTNNAVVTTSGVITVTVFPQPVTTPTLIQASCTSTAIGFNLGLTFIPASPVPNYTVVWSSIPNGVLSGQQTSVATGVSPGAYGYTVIANGGCGMASSFTLNPPPPPAIFTLSPFGTTQSLTCVTPTIEMSASDASYSYTWSSSSSTPQVGQTITLTSVSVGNWTVIGKNPDPTGCTRTLTFSVIQNTAIPSSTVLPLLQTITCSQTAAQTVSVFSNPTVNIAHVIYDPQFGTFAANSHTAIYTVGGPGTYTHCLINLENGCQTCKNFTVTSIEGYPTYTLSSPQNFTLGCSTKSVAMVNFVNATASTPGAGVSYTIIGPPTNTVVPPGTLSGVSSYSLTVPGTYTAICRELPSNCETRSQFSMVQDIAAPSATAIVPLSILDCDHTVTVLLGITETPNVSFSWGFQGSPGNVPGATVQVLAQLSQPTKTLINTYTLTTTDNNNLCKTQTVVPINQNAFIPKVGFSMGTASITCATPTIVLTNTSIPTIPPGTYPITQPVIGYLWQGPTPQDPVQISTTYLAGISGVYTLTGKDLNNGCFAVATQTVDDFSEKPIIFNTSPNMSIVTVTSGTNTIEEVQIPLDCGSLATILSVSATSSGANAKYSYTWTAPVGAVTGPNGLSTFSAGTVGMYTVLVTNTINSCASFTTMHVIAGKLTASVAIDKPTGFVPHVVTFYNNSSSSTGNSSITSVWSFGNGQFTTTTAASITPTMAYLAPGSYSISLNVKKGTCIATTTTNVIVDLPSKLEIPNSFSPNGDKINDIYFLNTAQMSEITCIIHDRWGHLVYELASGTGNVSWDGKNQAGVEVSEGVYFYVITGTGIDGQSYDEKGTITLFR